MTNKELDNKIEELEDTVNELKTENAVMKVQVSRLNKVCGLISGTFVTGIIGAVIAMLLK